MNRVYELRKTLCMSQEDIGKRIGRSISNIWKMENGIAPIPTDLFCSALHVRREWLENGIEPMFEEGCDPWSVAARVVQLRKTLYLTQEDLADVLGLSYSYIQRLEGAKAEIPVEVICEKLGAEKEWLLTGHGEMLIPGTPLPDYGTHVRELREYLGLSVKTMAEKIGINAINLSRNESGQPLSKETIDKICSAFGVTKAWLKYGTEPMFEPGMERKKYKPVEGSRLKKIREGARLSQIEFAEKIGKKHSSITYMEDGRMAISEETIQAVLAAFPIREEWLRYGEGRMYEEGAGGKKSKPEVVGARLKEARERYGLTQEDVSKRTGLGHTTISNIEMGAQKATQKTVDAICQGLEVNESWLRGRDVLMSSGVGSRAAQLRNHLSLSVRSMGKAIGVSGQGLLNMESNTYFFSPEQIRKICDEYGASENWLLYGLGPIFQEGQEVPAKTSAAEIKVKEVAAAKEAKEAEGTRRRQL